MEFFVHGDKLLFLVCSLELGFKILLEVVVKIGWYREWESLTDASGVRVDDEDGVVSCV
jgi:hypothetical protein